MRLFVALDIEPGIRERITAFRDQMRLLAPDVRWVGPETFHITLQFLGETKKLDEIRRALQNGEESRHCSLHFAAPGSFPTPRRRACFWIGIEADQRLQDACQRKSRRRCFRWDLQRDAGSYMPHLTLARSGSGRPRPVAASGPHLACNRCATQSRNDAFS